MSERADTLPNGAIGKAKLIQCAVPDNGIDEKLLRGLRKRFGELRARSASYFGNGALHETRPRRGKMPAANMIRLVSVVCSEAQADEIFAYFFREAGLDKPGNGMVWQGPLTITSDYALPDGVPEEQPL